MVNAELDMSAKLSLASDDRVPALRDARGDNVVDMAEAKARATDDAGYGEPQGSFVVLSDTPASETLLPDPPAASCEGNASKQATAGPVDAIKESVVDPDGGASDFTEQGVGASDPSLADETVEEKRGRLAWLLKDLAISEHEDLKTTFRKYVWAKYGRGWDERAKDLDKINDRLLLAMNDFQAFADEMDETIARFSDQRA